MNHMHYMMRALKLAAKGRTSPNPMVGAVIVADGRIVGEGYHKRAGEAHAEVVALQNAGQLAKGARVYVTLEPCSHHGRTPPCADALIAAGVSEVFVGMLDPDERVAGEGVRRLTSAGIKVQILTEAQESCWRLNEAYIKHRTTGLPFVTVKAAMSLDGRIATSEWDSKWITGEPARKYAHNIRSKTDAIMVGANTVRRDNPSLSARAGRRSCYPLRVVVSASGVLDVGANVFRLPGRVLVVLPRGTEAAIGLKNAGIDVFEIDSDGDRFSLRPLLVELGRMGVLSVLAEGGGQLIASLISRQLADKAMFYYAPKIIGGGASVAGVGELGIKKIEQTPRLTDVRTKKLGEDLLIEGYLAYG